MPETRPKPTKSLIMSLAGKDSTSEERKANYHLLKAIDGGGSDVSQKGIYPAEDLKEALAFDAASRILRTTDIEDFRKRVNEFNLYELFSYVYEAPISCTGGNIYQWMNGVANLSDEEKELFDQLNPFHGKRLEDRLNALPEGVVAKFKEDLKKNPDNYVCQRDAEEGTGATRKNPGEIHVLPGLKKGNARDLFAKRIAKRFGSYSPRIIDPRNIGIDPEEYSGTTQISLEI